MKTVPWSSVAIEAKGYHTELIPLVYVVRLTWSWNTTNRAVHLLHAHDVIGLGLRLGLVVL
jgi:hypothetical protein